MANAPLDPIILDGHIELAAEALDGLAVQAAAASRFLSRGHTEAAIAAYDRVRALHNGFVRPSMLLIRETMEGVLAPSTAPSEEDVSTSSTGNEVACFAGAKVAD